MRSKHVSAFVLGLAWALAGGAWAQGAQPMVTAVGTGTVTCEPDRAVVQLRVEVQDEASMRAQESLNKQMEKVVSAVRVLAIPDMVIKTQRLDLSPMYEQRDSGRRLPKVVGYRASSTISVQVDDVDAVGRVIDAGIGAGANSLGGLSFTLRDPAPATMEALEKAAKDAEAQAQTLARSLGLEVVGVLEANVGSLPITPRRVGMMSEASVAARGGLASVSAMSTVVEAGEVVVTASATVTYTCAARK